VLAQIRALFPRGVLDNALRAATDRCASQHEPALAQRILDIEEARRQFGLTDAVDTGPAAQCLTFELNIDTDFKTVGQRLPTEAHARATIPLHANATLTSWGGTAPLTYLTITEPYGDGGCTTQATGAGTWSVIDMQIAPGAVDRAGQVVTDAQPRSVTLLPPQSRESYTVTCPNAGSFSNSSYILSQGWTAAHADELVQGAFYAVQNWSSGNGGVFGSTSYSRTFQLGGVTWSETTTLQLLHTPS
jgi:hypothetical protein